MHKAEGRAPKQNEHSRCRGPVYQCRRQATVTGPILPSRRTRSGPAGIVTDSAYAAGPGTNAEVLGLATRLRLRRDAR
jgi:hypothetical protein